MEANYTLIDGNMQIAHIDNESQRNHHYEDTVSFENDRGAITACHESPTYKPQKVGVESGVVMPNAPPPPKPLEHHQARACT